MTMAEWAMLVVAIIAWSGALVTYFRTRSHK